MPFSAPLGQRTDGKGIQRCSLANNSVLVQMTPTVAPIAISLQPIRVLWLLSHREGVLASCLSARSDVGSLVLQGSLLRYGAISDLRRVQRPHVGVCDGGLFPNRADSGSLSFLRRYSCRTVSDTGKTLTAVAYGSEAGPAGPPY